MTPEDCERGDCYGNALILAISIEHGRVTGIEAAPDSVRVVHGYPRWGLDPSKRFGHAWVEFLDPVAPIVWVIDTNGTAAAVERGEPEWVVVNRAYYLRVGAIEEEHTERYDVAHAAANAASTGHPGPWHAGRSDAIFEGDEEEFLAAQQTMQESSENT